ncbi:MAG: GntR family transcriptional regulator [Amaricoccus sp.]|uniref:GntR family transcriptional regulator n=1 Tax=Amaricoccus sp. TaxID=1872485 RepID=UPI0039E6698F
MGIRKSVVQAISPNHGPTCENARDMEDDLTPPRTGSEQTTEDASERICATLMEAVSERALSPGTKLMEDVIARHFGVSRTAVRGAIAILERAHLVELRRNHGSFIASPDRAEARQLLETRRVLEMATIAAVMTAATPAELDRLERLTLEEETVHSGADDGAKQRLSGNFHVELARAAGNAVMEEMLQNVLARLSLVAALYERDDGRKCGAVDHRGILAAIRSGDVAAATAAMSQHLDDLEAMLDLDASPDNEDTLSIVLRKFAPSAPAVQRRPRRPPAPPRHDS